MGTAMRLVLAGAAAGAMGWGIRGQYGHETGAMIAGLLVSLVIVLGIRPDASRHVALRAVAFGTIGVGFGGAMTYGQTLGLSHDPALVGHWDALGWGLLGVALKGAVWIGWFGACLGMGLSPVRYRAREMALLMLALVGATFVGTWLFNAPFDPDARVLPRLYFSADWHWQPDAPSLTPRREVWGGLLVALVALGAYVRLVRRDAATLRLLRWGVVGGGLGFPLGQSLQAWHAWNPEVFASGVWARLDPHINWWNTMETTFGAVMGAAVTWGAWRHRHAWAPMTTPAVTSLPAGFEWAGITTHVVLLVLAEFTDVPVLGRYADISLLMGVLPLALVAEGRWAPAVLALPVTLLPIAGKTVRRLVYQEQAIAPLAGWLLYGVVPLALMGAAAWWLTRRQELEDETGRGAHRDVRRALRLATWTCVALNFAFFAYPWPWAPWTTRTLHALVFFACAGVVTWVSRDGEFLHPG